MSQKTLAVILSKFKPFDKPKRELEQYPTDADIAAKALWQANMLGWIKDKKIVDLGAGTGILGAGCLLLGAKKLIFVEKDAKAIQILKENMNKLNDEYELGAQEIKLQDINSEAEKYDLVVMNPPFGTFHEGTDLQFLNIAMKLSTNIITMHKTQTDEHITNKINEANFDIIKIIHTKFALKKTLKEHKKHIERIDVTIYLISKSLPL